VVNKLVNLQEVGAQVNRVGNAVGIHSGAMNVMQEEWTKLVAYIGPLLQDIQAKEKEIADLKAKIAAMPGKTDVAATEKSA
jgi:uncharacterized protein YoxC